MSSTETISHAAPAPFGRARALSPRLLFWGGTGLLVASLALFFMQVFWAQVLITPWYVPIGGTIASLMVLGAFARQRRWWQLPIALICVAVTGLEWYFLLALTVLPAYSGPLAVGSSIPAFRASAADGTEISEAFFQQDRPTALIFFQGRWCPFCMTHLRELEAHHDEFDRVGARAVIVSIESVEDAAQTQREFPHLTVISDERRQLSNAIDLINRGFAPDGSDAAIPTIIVLDRAGKVQWIHRPTRFIARPSAAELARQLKNG